MLTPVWRRRHKAIDWSGVLDRLWFAVAFALLVWLGWTALAAHRAGALG